MTFLELIELVNEANDIPSEKLTPEEYAALMQAQAEADDLELELQDVSAETGESPGEDVDPERFIDDSLKLKRQQATEKIKTLQQEFDEANTEYIQLITKGEKSQEDTKQLAILSNRLKTITNELNSLKSQQPRSERIDEIQEDIEKTQKEYFSILHKADKTDADVAKLTELRNRFYVMYRNVEEEERRIAALPDAEVYTRGLRRVEAKLPKNRGLRSKKDIPDPIKMKQTAKEIRAEYDEIRAYKAAEAARLEYELQTGTGKKPFAPDPEGVVTSQIFNMGIPYKRITHSHWNWNLDLKNFAPDPKTGEWRAVSKTKAYNVPRMVGKVFNAVAESGNADKYFREIENIFSEYKPIYDTLSKDVRAMGFYKQRIEFLENKLSIAEETMVANTQQRIERYENFIAKLSEKLKFKAEEIRNIIKSGGDASSQLSEYRLLEREKDDAEKLGKPLPDFQHKGSSRDIYSEIKRLVGKKEALESELSDAYKEYNAEQSSAEEMHKKLDDEALDVESRTAISEILEKQARPEVMKHFNTIRRVKEELELIRKELVNLSTKALKYESDTSKGKRAPTLPSSRSYTSVAFELNKQRKLLRSFKGLVASYRYGKVQLKQLTEKDADKVIERNGEYVFPKGNEFLRVVYREVRGDDVPFVIVGYTKGLDGYGARPGRGELEQPKNPIKGFLNNDGYYQSLENAQKNVEELSAQLDSKREKVLEELLKILEAAVGQTYSTKEKAIVANPNIASLRAWIGLKKLQKSEAQKEDRVQQYTIDPAISLYNFYINSRSRKLRRLDTKTSKLSDLTKTISHYISPLPPESLTDFVRMGAGEKGDKRLKAAYENAKKNVESEIKQAGDDSRLIAVAREYFDSMSLTKQEFLDEIKKISQTPAPEPSNVVPFSTGSSSGAIDMGEDDINLLAGSDDGISLGESDASILANLIDADSDIATKPAELSAEQQSEIQFDDEYLERKLQELQQERAELEAQGESEPPTE